MHATVREGEIFNLMENENPKGKVKFLKEGEFQKVGKFPWILHQSKTRYL